jgi:hypothetical protein
VRKAPWGISIKEQKKGMFNALLFKKHPQLYREKIQQAPPWNYYMMVICALAFVLTTILNLQLIAAIAFLCWVILLVAFTNKRLRHTSKKTQHVAEMIVTSICIPFISVYWQLYGAWRYRVLFL